MNHPGNRGSSVYAGLDGARWHATQHHRELQRRRAFNTSAYALRHLRVPQFGFSPRSSTILLHLVTSSVVSFARSSGLPPSAVIPFFWK